MRKLAPFLLPDKPQLALYFISSLILIVLFDIQDYSSYYKSQIIGGSTNLTLFSGNNPISNFLSQSRLAEGLFWGVLGAIIYLGIWIFNSTVVNVKNDLKADKFVHPANFDRHNFWQTIITYKVLLFATITGGIICIFNGFRLAHFGAKQFYQAVLNSSGVIHSLWIVTLSLLLAMLFLHAFVLLIKSLLYFSRVVYRGL